MYICVVLKCLDNRRGRNYFTVSLLSGNTEHKTHCLSSNAATVIKLLIYFNQHVTAGEHCMCVCAGASTFVCNPAVCVLLPMWIYCSTPPPPPLRAAGWQCRANRPGQGCFLLLQPKRIQPADRYLL